MPSMTDPLMSDEDLAALCTCAQSGGALCTVTAIDGSWSRRLGAQLAVRPDGTTVGSLSDGCLERGLAVEALKGGAARTLHIGRGSRYVDIRLPCGSAVDVVVDPQPDLETLRAIVSRLADREPADLEIPLESGGTFIRRYLPPLQLVIAGSGPEVGSLARFAGAGSIPVRMLRPFGEQGGTLSLGREPVEQLDPWTAVAILFHDHEWERALLPWALRSGAFYVGAQGGAAARAERRKRLNEAGVTETEMSRLVSPIGVIGGARTPDALALSILTDIMFRFEGLRTAAA